jgi:DNA polymerase III alpha subunit (gram-positive type)
MNKEYISIGFDTETSGLIKPQATSIEKQPHIFEIFCQKLIHKSNGEIEVIDGMGSMLDPGVPVSSEITKITGIKQSDVDGAPSFGEFYPKLCEFFIGASELYAHNLAFDRAMLANELTRINKVIQFPWPHIHTCTVQKSMHIEQRRMSLTKLYDHFFGTTFSAHRAEDDVNAMTKCYIELYKGGYIA